jgi:hypothetical protein
MKDEITQQRLLAEQRFLNGDKPASICASLGRIRAWLDKWGERHLEDNASWSANRSRRPLSLANRTPTEIEEIIKMVRLNLYNRGLCSRLVEEIITPEVQEKPRPRQDRGSAVQLLLNSNVQLKLSGFLS